MARTRQDTGQKRGMKAKRAKKQSRLTELARQVERAKLPPFKRWTKTNLKDRDWDFLGFCEELGNAVSILPDAKAPFLVSRAFHWELDRELGSGNGPFDLACEFEHERRPIDDSRERVVVIVRRGYPTVSVPIVTPLPWLHSPERKLDDLDQRVGLNEWPVAELAWYLPPDASSVSRGSNNICALEIPWTVDEDEVVEAFRAWLRRHRGKHTDKAGRKHEWRIWFLKLAIYRLGKAGYSHSEVLKKLAETFEKMDRGAWSPQNCARAKRFICEKLNWRFETMLHQAKSMEQDHPGMGFGEWRRWFIKYQTAKANFPCQQSPPDS